MSNGITMKTIAAMAGVTQATVSMSLANSPRISAATRQRIQSLAARLGYRPNPYVSALMRIRREGRALRERPTLALVCAMHTADGWRNNASATIRQQREGAFERATQRGYRPQEFWLHRDDMSNERFSEMLHARGIQGVLISPLAEGDMPPALNWDYFATVSLSVPLPSLTVTTICNDHYFSSLQAVRECHRRGYRKPGIVLRQLHQQRFQGRWLAGHLIAAHLHPGLQLAKPLLVDDWSNETCILDWLKEERPDVIITPSSEALPAILARHGWRIPEDIGFAVLSSSQLGDTYSGVFQNGRMVGALAVDTLVAMMERHEHGLPQQATTVMLEGQWNEGATLPPRDH